MSSVERKIFVLGSHSENPRKDGDNRYRHEILNGDFRVQSKSSPLHSLHAFISRLSSLPLENLESIFASASITMMQFFTQYDMNAAAEAFHESMGGSKEVIKLVMCVVSMILSLFVIFLSNSDMDRQRKVTIMNALSWTSFAIMFLLPGSRLRGGIEDPASFYPWVLECLCFVLDRFSDMERLLWIECELLAKGRAVLLLVIFFAPTIVGLIVWVKAESEQKEPVVTIARKKHYVDIHVFLVVIANFALFALEAIMLDDAQMERHRATHRERNDKLIRVLTALERLPMVRANEIIDHPLLTIAMSLLWMPILCFFSILSDVGKRQLSWTMVFGGLACVHILTRLLSWSRRNKIWWMFQFLQLSFPFNRYSTTIPG